MVASSIEVEKEKSVLVKETVNSGSYLARHNGQIFSDGRSFSGFERNVFWVSTGDGYVDLSELSGADSPNDSRAVIAADLDDDGDVDLFVHSIQRERHALYRNDAVEPGSAGHGFLKLRLRGTRGNAEAVGATVVVRGPRGPVAQVLARGSGFASCLPPELVFGLGAAPSAAVEVHWPGGARESFGELASGSRALLVEGSGEATPFPPTPVQLDDPLPGGLRVGEGQLLTKLRLHDAQGRPRVVDVRELADGKPLFVNFWASYCVPCVDELDTLESIHGRGNEHVLAISVDAASDVKSAERLLERAGATFPSFYGLGDEGGEGAGEGLSLEQLVDLERLGLPTTLVLTPEGRVDTILRGPL